MAYPPIDVLEAGPPPRRRASKKRKRSKQAPLPAVVSSGGTTVPAPAGKAMLNANTQITSLNRLRGLRMRTSGGNY